MIEEMGEAGRDENETDLSTEEGDFGVEGVFGRALRLSFFVWLMMFPEYFRDFEKF